MYYRLVATNPGNGLGQKVWSFQLPAMIGRNPEHAVYIDHESISRTHCQLYLDGSGALMVRDLHSTNGTYVDDNRIERSLLSPGDILQVGGISLRVDYGVDKDPGKPKAITRPRDLATTVPMHVPPAPPRRQWWQFWL